MAKLKPDHNERTYPLSIEDMNKYRQAYYPHGSGPIGPCRLIVCLLDELANTRGYGKNGIGYEAQYTLERVSCNCVGISHSNDCPHWVLPH